MKSRLTFAFLSLLFAAAPALADNFDITCQTLGQVGQCENVTICQSRTEGMCAAKPGMGADWVNACRNAGPTQQMCGWQTFCEWRADTMCVPRR